MTKELVISSNRHETKVAVLEDDQLVEVYFERENEYSLAGSIHKGRVTRVLPGMQSAFVDIGLDRDAFLYVSDFFEDNEEYDKIVSSVEDKVLRLEKGGPPPVPAEPEAAPAAEAPAPAPVPPAPARTEAAAPPAFALDDRRKGRGRRRRTRGRGFPESKYAAPAPPAPVVVENGQEEREFPVLPGESLAKYRGVAEDEIEAEVEQGPVLGEYPEAAEPEPESRAAAEERAEAGEPAGEEAEAALPEVEQEAAPAAEPAAAQEEQAPPVFPTPLDDVTPAEEPIELAAEVYEAEEAASAAGEETPVEPAAAEASGARAEAEGAEEGEPGADTEPAAVSEAAGENGPAVETGEVEPVEAEEGPEPARMPTSLTAALREQGSRYLHRTSRRMRRKMRGGEEPRPPQRPEVKPAEQRTVSRPEKGAQPSISDLLREGQEIIVQVAKEPLGQKGARITSHIALPGRYLVYMPTVDHIGVSRKIPTDEERMRLKRILQANRAGIPGGYIVRTAGEGKTEEELRADMLFLYNLWLDLRQKAEKKKGPALIHHDLSVVERVLRDQLTSTFKTIWTDNEEVYESILGFVQRFQPALVNRVKLYTRPTPVFDAFGVTPELEKALRPKVWLKSGGYIVINQTEALVAIDINTGKYVGKSNRLEDTIVKTNTDAIREIVRQIRLRDLGGIIVVDFIDMDERKNRQKVMQALEEAMRSDRAPYKILQFNDFGLVAITRKRVKQSLERTLCAPCPYCEGSGYVKSAQTVVGEILQEAHKIAPSLEDPDVMLRVSPDVARLLKSTDNTYLQELEEILKRNVIVKSDAQLHQEKFDLA
ncbi:MAG: Rne/Rng family ribonuclease [Bryobacterales bacterium]|nr:Rne/Rng family ribonuclease [Bryobacterales bacterium]